MHPVAGVTGWPIEQSKSPVIHQFWLNKLGLAGRYIRVPAPPHTRFPDAVIAFLREASLMGHEPAGLSVTMPLKEQAACYVGDEPGFRNVDYYVERTGSANCLVRKNNRWLLFNTDVHGFAEPLRRRGSWAGSSAILFGSGGVARSVLLALDSLRFSRVTVVSRHPRRAKRAMQRVTESGLFRPSVEFIPFHYAKPRADILINATPLGMEGFDQLNTRYMEEAHWGDMPQSLLVYDLVTRDTRLQQVARQRGHKVIDGVEMLIEQADEQFGRFYGASAPRAFDGELKQRLVDGTA